ncbi:signal transduction protein [Fibrella aestuarina BUZ 2]|uniref:Signal transduction protein n=1 Tax=Fibrella aestuarina BUZ 2 TaxID=1166018 RepID=I0K5G5_9BACT|nr:NACHT domain-containing protein [Fibrella aestuarina]CCG99368.1 signal transduction protein [Fibrella aestuarina BUZ 2]
MAVSGALLGSWLFKKVGDEAVKMFSEDEINKQFKKCLSQASKDLSLKYPTAFGGSIASFLQTEEVYDEVFKMLFINVDLDKEKLSKHIDFATLPDSFFEDMVVTIKSQILKDYKLFPLFSNMEILNKVSQLIEGKNNLTDISSRNLRETLDIKKSLDEYFSKKFSYNDFIDIYFRNAKITIKDVNFFGLGIEQTYKKPRVDLKKIFIEPYFKYTFKDSNFDSLVSKVIRDADGNNSRKLNANDIFKISRNIIILGNPGAGKSMFIKAIMYGILFKESSHLNFSHINECIPIRIELRKYLAYKKNQGGGILQYIAYLFKNEYSIDFIDVDDILIIISRNSVLVFFDGLDEIFNINDKTLVRNDIVNFVDQHKVYSLVTSRFTGYDDAKLDDKHLEIEILDFNTAQIKEYVEKWYEIEESDNDTRRIEINNFLSVSDKLSNELLHNPLLLSLIVILYRNNLRLPESKLEIYQSCTKTLVDKWDAQKDLDIVLPENILNRKETIFADLAHWQYKLISDHPSKLNYNAVLDAVTNSIKDRLKIDDWAYARNMSEIFMNYAERRSIYFDNNFTHKTFLEYFTAFWIYSNYDKKYLIEERNKLIDKYIDNPFWFIVFELLLNMIDNSQPDSDIIDEIYDRQINVGQKTYEFLLIALSSLKNISRQIIYKLVKASFSYLLMKYRFTQENRFYVNSEARSEEHSIFEALRTYINGTNNSELLIDIGKSCIQSNVDDINKVSSLVFELLHRTPAANFIKIYNSLIGEESRGIPAGKQEHFAYIAYLYALKDSKDIVENLRVFKERYGMHSFFVSFAPCYGEWSYVSVSQYFLTSVFSSENPEVLCKFFNQIFSEKRDKDSFLYNIYIKSESLLYRSVSEIQFKQLLDAYGAEDNIYNKVLLLILIVNFVARDRIRGSSKQGLDLLEDVRLKEAYIRYKNPKKGLSEFKKFRSFVQDVLMNS